MSEAEGHNANTRWMLTHAEGSVRQILSADGTAMVTNYDYDAFGNIIEPDASLPAGVVVLDVKPSAVAVCEAASRRLGRL